MTEAQARLELEGAGFRFGHAAGGEPLLPHLKRRLRSPKFREQVAHPIYPQDCFPPDPFPKSTTCVSTRETRPPSYLGSVKREPEPPGDRHETRILLAASQLLEKPAERRAALAFVLADTSLAHTREILGPVLRDKSAKKPLSRENSLAPDALAFARSLLAAEVARPLDPYPDWTRPCPSVEPPKPEPHRYYQPSNAKSTQALAELSAFMADPAAQTHEFRYAQDVRSALETFIQQRFLDLDHSTIRKGTPHTLACTKNDNSYHHALALREKDEMLLATLNGL